MSLRYTHNAYNFEFIVWRWGMVVWRVWYTREFLLKKRGWVGSTTPPSLNSSRSNSHSRYWRPSHTPKARRPLLKPWNEKEKREREKKTQGGVEPPSPLTFPFLDCLSSSAKTGLPLWMLGLGADRLRADMNRLLALLFHQVDFITLLNAPLPIAGLQLNPWWWWCCFHFFAGSAGWAVLAAAAASGWNFSQLRFRGRQHLLPRVWEAFEESPRATVIFYLPFLFKPFLGKTSLLVWRFTLVLLSGVSPLHLSSKDNLLSSSISGRPNDTDSISFSPSLSPNSIFLFFSFLFLCGKTQLWIWWPVALTNRVEVPYSAHPAFEHSCLLLFWFCHGLVLAHFPFLVLFPFSGDSLASFSFVGFVYVHQLTLKGTYFLFEGLLVFRWKRVSS